MPQLTLAGSNGARTLSLSPNTPRSTRRPPAATGAVDLRALHHEAEDTAGALAGLGNTTATSSAAAQSEGLAEAGQDDAASGSKAEVKRQLRGDAGTSTEGKAEGKVPRGLPSNKRSRSPEGGGVAGDSKRQKNAYEIKGKIATADDAARADDDPPLDQLMRLLKAEHAASAERGECVVYWMRMEDMRVEDNTALSLAASKASELGLPVVGLFVLSPGDYKWHDRSARRIDFMLRNLRWCQQRLDALNIPLHLVTFDRRLTIPRRLVDEVFPSLRTSHVFANIEYEVDELRRDIAVVRRARERGIDVVCVHDRLAVPPGRVLSQQGKPMSVYSPWQRAWAKVLAANPELLEESPVPAGNDGRVRSHDVYAQLFDTAVPDAVEGFECENEDIMRECWPEGTDNAKELLDRFLRTAPRKSQLELVSPLRPGAEVDLKRSRVAGYQDGRNRVDADNSSRLSPYLASGVISARMVLNAARGGKRELQSGRDTGVGMWVQEVAWRDFYNHVMAIWPRVSMGRPFLEKFADVQWEVNEEHLQAWKDGMTGFPIVDAAMRACKARGWMENRVRMVAASFLVKSLMLDWRLGERHFMQSFVDGDLAANNGGWQWTASTGTDPQPYFRIFNTLTQSEKCDPNGDYIRYWVPELRGLRGKAVHDPSRHLPSGEFRKLGYPAPIVDHKTSRERALFRYKHVGEKEA
ncbi:DNA photolyase phr1 [Cryptotrichosporon argae]